MLIKEKKQDIVVLIFKNNLDPKILLFNNLIFYFKDKFIYHYNFNMDKKWLYLLYSLKAEMFKIAHSDEYLKYY